MWKNILCHGHDKLHMHMHLEIETFVSTKSLMVQITIILVLKFALTQHLHFSPSKCEVFQVTCDIQLIKSFELSTWNCSFNRITPNIVWLYYQLIRFCLILTIYIWYIYNIFFSFHWILSFLILPFHSLCPFIILSFFTDFFPYVSLDFPPCN